MATYSATSAFIPQFLDDNGDPISSGGTIEAFIAGTSTPQLMYSNKAGVSAGNTITLNARGEPETSGVAHIIWIDTAVEYDFVLKKDGVTVNSPEDIGAAALNSNPSVATITALKAITAAADGQSYFVRGHTAVGDGGGGNYLYDASSAVTANDGTVITPDTLAGRFLLHDSCLVTPRTFGPGDAGIIAAISWASANNQMLFWPEVYAVTSNITSFHSARHYGPGGLSRNGNTWYVEQSPSQEDRRLYVSTASGSATNDGLDTTYPLAAEPAALTAMLTINPNNDEVGYITLKSDHVITDASMMTINKVNAGWIVIEGDGTYGDSGYTFASAYPSTGWSYDAGDHNPVSCNCTASTGSRYVVGWEASMPELRIFVDGNSQLDRLYSGNRSTGKIEETYGGKNFRSSTSARPCYNSGGLIVSSRTVWDNFTGSIYFARGAGGNMTQALIKNRSSAINGSLTSSRTASVEAQGIEFQSCAFPLEVKRGAQINALDAIIDDVDSEISNASRSASLCLDGMVATNIHDAGVNANSGGQISMQQGTSQPAAMTASGSNPGNEPGIKCTGGHVQIPSGTISGGFEDGILCTQGGVVDGTALNISGTQARYGVYAVGGEINITSATVQGGTTNDIGVAKGGIVRADSATTSSGSPSAADCNVAALNTIYAAGVVFG